MWAALEIHPWIFSPNFCVDNRALQHRNSGVSWTQNYPSYTMICFLKQIKFMWLGKFNTERTCFHQSHEGWQRGCSEASYPCLRRLFYLIIWLRHWGKSRPPLLASAIKKELFDASIWEGYLRHMYKRLRSIQNLKAIFKIFRFIISVRNNIWILVANCRKPTSFRITADF